jgi:hypothetical protein
MADRTGSRPPTPRPKPGAPQAGPNQPRQRETADERRVRQTATALAKQVDLKREAAERRDRKGSPDSR